MRKASFAVGGVRSIMSYTHRAIALDLPGYGLSDKPLDVAYDYDFYADTLDAFLDALNNSPRGRSARRSKLDKCSVYGL